MDTKKCVGPLCNGVEVPIEKFGKCKARKDGLSHYCKPCNNHKAKTHRVEKPELAKARGERSRQKEDKEWRKNYWADWYEKNADTKKAYTRQWATENADKVREYNANRRALEKERTRIKPIRGWWKALLNFYGEQCMNPDCASGEILTHDHVVALTKGGWHEFSNWQVLCFSCNSAKGAHHSSDYRDLEKGVLVDVLFGQPVVMRRPKVLYQAL
ncbi:HNH endonuclease [Streptomyces sp. NPDC059513]|uniref:HNH endonuclease n=1 Tax=unclassified Streptomyces TaxID=2593676 RepID=UPI0036C1F20E